MPPNSAKASLACKKNPVFQLLKLFDREAHPIAWRRQPNLRYLGQEWVQKIDRDVRQTWRARLKQKGYIKE
jgi:hypothetical protein